MANPLVAAAAVKGGFDLLGGLVGSKEPKVPRTPFDMRSQRRNNIGLQNYLLGFSPSFSPYREGTPGVKGSGGMGPAINAQSPAGGGGQQGGMDLAAILQALRGGVPNPNITPQPQTGGFTPGNAGVQPWTGPRAMLGGGGFTGAQGGGGQQFQGPMANAQGGGYPSNPYGQQPGGTFNSQIGQGPANNDMLGRMESYFGPLGTPTTALQQQSLGGISQFLNSNPYGQSNNALGGVLGGQGYNEANQAFRGVGGANYFGGAQNAFNQAGQANNFGGAEGVFNRLENYNPFGAAQGSMEGILGANPGQGMMAALQPSFERNLAAANQQGGRFGSANAILRSRAVDDFNLLGAQALQRGTDQQIAAAGQYGMMGNSLLGARANAGQGLLGVGQGRTGQQLGAAQGLLGVGQGRLDQGLGSAGGLGQLAMALSGDRLNAAGQLATNQNAMFNNLQGGFDTGQRQAEQEAQRQQQALQILLDQLSASQQVTYQGRG